MKLDRMGVAVVLAACLAACARGEDGTSEGGDAGEGGASGVEEGVAVDGAVEEEGVAVEGAGAEADVAVDGADAGDEVGLTAGQSVSAAPIFKRFDWNAGATALDLWPTSDSICLLTRVTGEFRGGAESVSVEAGGDGLWHLRVTSLQPGVAGSAYCFKKSNFKGPPGYGIWTSEPIVRQIASSSCKAIEGGTWWGDAVTFIQGISGDLRGAGEMVEVVQSNSPITSSTLRVNTCQPEGVLGRAQSFFVGVPSNGRLAKFIGLAGTGPALSVGTYAVNVGGFQDMAPTKDAMCGLTRIAGAFNGGGESVEVSPVMSQSGNVQVWRLTTKALSGGGVHAQARCFAYDQS